MLISSIYASDGDSKCCSYGDAGRTMQKMNGSWAIQNDQAVDMRDVFDVICMQPAQTREWAKEADCIVDIGI